jgi:hypothetical protein
MSIQNKDDREIIVSVFLLSVLIMTIIAVFVLFWKNII